MDTSPSTAPAQRFSALFETLDTDHDSFLTWNDYQRLVTRYVKGYNLDPEGDRAEAIRSAYWGLWGSLLQHSGSLNGSLEREEFVSSMSAVAEDGSRHNPIEGLADAAFSLLDEDGDGSISEDEYVEYAEILGVAVDVAWERFQTLDTDGDGSISREEFAQSAREFLYSQEAESAGGFIFGMV